MDARIPKASPSETGRHHPLHSTDLLLFTFWGLLSFTSLLFHGRLRFWWGIPAANAVAILALWWVARAAQSTGSKVLRRVHDWSPFPLVIFTYKQLYYLIRPLHEWRDYDQVLIRLDRLLFAGNPTQWLAQFANPFTTELLQIAYSLFYAIFLIIGYELYRQRDHSRFRAFSFAIVYGFLLSYLAYFSLPSVGPRFTLHNFSRLDSELPGLVVTPALRAFVNFFESIRPGMSSSVAEACAQRDVFPSGHTMMTVVAIVLAYHYGLKVRHFVLVLGSLLILATVYLRYHYAVDLLAGIVLGVVCLLSVRTVYCWFGSDKATEQ